MSDANRALLSFVEETTFGEAPGTALTNIRYTSESLRSNTGSVQSQEIRADRAIADIIRTGLSAQGDINWEWSYEAHDAFIVALLQAASAWGSSTAVITADTTVEVTDTNTITLNTGSWDTTPTVGEWIEVRGFTGSAVDNGYFKVAAATTTTIDVEGTPLVADAAGEAVTIVEMPSIATGITFKTYTIEKHLQDLTNTFLQEFGMGVDQGQMSVAADQIITGSFSYVGKREERATATVGTGSNTAAPTNDVMNGVDHVKQPKLGGTAFDIVSSTWQLQNNLRARLQVGTLGAVSVGSGTATITGTLQAYFSDDNKAELDKNHDFTETAWSFITEDAAGNAYVFDWPAIKITSAQVVAGGQNQDIVLDMQWQAKLDATELVQMKIAKIAA